MEKVSVVIPCYGPPNEVERCIAALAIQWKREDITVIMVDDASPHGGYEELAAKYRDKIEIRLIRNEKNLGQGLARQAGIDAVETKIFCMADEDDIYTPLAISQLVGVYEGHYLEKNAEGAILLDENGEPRKAEGVPEIAVISGSIFEWDEHHTKILPADNRVWINCKLYNKEFLLKHNIRFNEASSHRSEDYYWSSCLFAALDNDPDYVGVLLDDNNPLYLWYPRETSRSRVDEHYGFLLSPYTMQSSVDILRFMKECKTIEWTDKTQIQYEAKALNMACYSFYTFLSFIRRVATTDFSPTAKEWETLCKACNELREVAASLWDKYSYERRQDELFGVRHYTDCQITPAWVEFDEYVLRGTTELDWSYEELMRCKGTYTFNDDGRLIGH